MRARAGRAWLGAFVAVVVACAALGSALAAPSELNADDVTIAARPSVVGSDHPITLYGSVRSRRPGETVEIETRDCGQTFFRGFAATHTDAGGTWSSEFFPGITTEVRAVWKGRKSRAVKVFQRAMLRFAPKASDRTRFVVSVVARAQFWRKRIVVERFDARRSQWRRYRLVVLTKQNAPGEFVWTSGEFSARVPKGTLRRAVLPANQAGPCYLTSTSPSVRTD